MVTKPKAPYVTSKTYEEASDICDTMLKQGIKADAIAKHLERIGYRSARTKDFVKPGIIPIMAAASRERRERLAKKEAAEEAKEAAQFQDSTDKDALKDPQILLSTGPDVTKAFLKDIVKMTSITMTDAFKVRLISAIAENEPLAMDLIRYSRPVKEDDKGASTQPTK